MKIFYELLLSAVMARDKERANPQRKAVKQAIEKLIIHSNKNSVLWNNKQKV